MAPVTPQQNSVVERKFPTLMGRARAMMTHAGFDDYFKRKFWCEAVSTATKLDNMMVRHIDPKYRKYLRIFGEIGMVANHERKSVRTKLNKEEK